MCFRPGVVGFCGQKYTNCFLDGAVSAGFDVHTCQFPLSVYQFSILLQLSTFLYVYSPIKNLPVPFPLT